MTSPNPSLRRYACPSIDELWTLDAQYERWMFVWRATAAVIGHPLPEIDAPLVGFAHTVERFEAQFGHDVAAAAEAYRQLIQEVDTTNSARWVHFGLCSSDVVDAGNLIAIWRASSVLDGLARDAYVAIDGLARLTTAVTVYRTHGQAARLGPSSARWVGHASLLRDAVSRLMNSLPHRVGFDGPTGTGGLLTDDQRDQIAADLSFMTDESDTGRQAQDRIEWSRWLSSVADLASVAERFATEVRLLAATGVDEVSEPPGVPGYRGSSSMPHKRNPTRSERICGLAPVVRGLARGYEEAACSVWGSHSLEHSSAERVTFPLVTSLVGFVLTEVAAIASDLKVDADAVRRNVADAPADSFVARNAMVARGLSPDAAYEAARGELDRSLLEPDPSLFHSPEGDEKGLAELRAEYPQFVSDAPDRPTDLVESAQSPKGLQANLQNHPEFGTIAVSGSVVPATSADALCTCDHPRDAHRDGVGSCREPVGAQKNEDCLCGAFVRSTS